MQNILAGCAVLLLLLLNSCSQTATGSPIDGNASWTNLSSSLNLPQQSSAANSSEALSSSASADSLRDLGAYRNLFVWVPGGSFVRSDGATVSVRGFFMGKTEVTQNLYDSLMKHNPSYFQTQDSLPVESLTWDNATTFCNRLSLAIGLDTAYPTPVTRQAVVRLPTEAEWEYAARAGSQASYSWGDAISGLVPSLYTNPNISTGPEPVASHSANAYGLFDMEGNVWEWTGDWYAALTFAASLDNPQGPSSGSTRVIRGGGFSTSLVGRTLSTRTGQPGSTSKSDLGFRVVISVTP